MNEPETMTAPEPTAAPRKWAVNDANPPGPIQVNRFNKAMRAISSEHNTMRERWGVIGVQEHEACMTAIFGAGRREDVAKVQQEIGKKYDWTVSKANVNTIIAAMESALPALCENRPVKDKRITPEQDAEEKAERRQRDEEQAVKDAARKTLVDAAVVRLRAQYPWASQDSTLRQAPRASANCKNELTRTWPHVRFSVRSDHNSIRVGWNDGPTAKQVRAIVGKYAGNPEGMQECTDDERSIFISACEHVLGSVTYQSVDRGYGENHTGMKIQNDVADWILALEGIKAGGKELWDVRIPRFENGSFMGATTAARQLMDATEFPPGATVKGVEWNKGEGGANVPENVYTLLLDVPEASSVPVGDGVAQSSDTNGMIGKLGTVAKNDEHNGVEIAFDEKPDDALRFRLRRAGFRITRRPPWRWYQKFSASAWERACELAGVVKECPQHDDEKTENARGDENWQPGHGMDEAEQNCAFDATARAIGA